MLELVAVCFFLHIYDASAINGLPMAGKFEITHNNLYPALLPMYKGSHIEVQATCVKEGVQIKWSVKKSDCLNAMREKNLDIISSFYGNTCEDGNDTNTYVSQFQTCNKQGYLKDESSLILEKMGLSEGRSNMTTKQNTSDKHLHRVAVAWDDGIYSLFICVQCDLNPCNFSALVEIKNKQEQYLSAADWPLLPFFGVMCGVYIIIGIIWLVLMMWNWKDLLRIQFWIGAVILLGMIEKAVFLAEYESLNVKGTSVTGALVFAEIVSCLKRTLARVLVIIVSLGFGIVKPRLGAAANKVVAAGVIYFVLALVERCTVIFNVAADFKVQLFVIVPLSICDALICWWIFTSLIQTMRTLKLRRNVVKLSLYRHFTNTLIFTVLASVVFMVWSMIEHKMPECIYDWKELWVDDAVWHLLFSIILIVIMILWRPNANSQRYAFSPLLDQDDDDDAHEAMINDAFDGMKLRGSGSQSGFSKEGKSKDDSLKWVEDNIPTSIVDSALPSLLDSDEEVMTTKFEMSKME